MTAISLRRQRLAVFLVSLAVLFMEIVLIRELAIRFWEHLASLVISIALLGFGTSGTLLVLLNRYLPGIKPALGLLTLLGMALSIPLCLWLGDRIDFNLIQMVWQPGNIWALGALELVWAIPFLFAGMFIGLALEEGPERVPGHYAASFLGSGLGGFVALPALFLASPRLLLLSAGTAVLLIALLHVRDLIGSCCWATVGLLMAVLVWQVPHVGRISADKDLPQILAMPGSLVSARRFTPQGLIEIVEAPAMHPAPGLALNSTEPVPPQRLVIVDAQIVGSLFTIHAISDFAFLDQTTQALPYRLRRFGRVLIVDDTGNDGVGLALLHRSAAVTALTGNSSLADLKLAPVSSITANPYRFPGVSLVSATTRGFLRKSTERYSLVVLPTTGTDPGGLTATAADSLFTIETLRLCLDRLDETGVLSVSAFAQQPPRESLRLLWSLATVLREKGMEPNLHIAMIRNWASVTIVAQMVPLTSQQTSAIREFSKQRGFDLIWLPDIAPAEVNRFHLLDRDDYHLGAAQLLSSSADRFVREYLYDLTVPDDNRPFFHHFSRWRGISEVTRQLGNRGRAFLELGTILLLAAFGQALLLAFTCMVLPLVPAIGLPGRKTELLATLGFFTAIGLGFMLLEIGMLQRLTTYLAHPIYAAAIVFSGFLVFGGIGSSLTSRFKPPLSRLHCGLALAVAAVAGFLLLVIHRLLTATEMLDFPFRVIVSLLSIAPLSTLMGTLFPLGLKRIGQSQAPLVPWAWSANGFASVLATLAAPILAMTWGFDLVAGIAIGCYLLAAWLSLRLPGENVDSSPDS